jgi:hypothetical protein
VCEHQQHERTNISKWAKLEIEKSAKEGASFIKWNIKYSSDNTIQFADHIAP